MTILDTFYILFKSDAKDAQKDNAALDKADLDSMGDKEKKRTESEVKAHRELSKQRKETTSRHQGPDRRLPTSSAAPSSRWWRTGRRRPRRFLALGAIKSGVLNAAAAQFEPRDPGQAARPERHRPAGLCGGLRVGGRDTGGLPVPDPERVPTAGGRRARDARRQDADRPHPGRCQAISHPAG